MSNKKDNIETPLTASVDKYKNIKMEYLSYVTQENQLMGTCVDIMQNNYIFFTFYLFL